MSSVAVEDDETSASALEQPRPLRPYIVTISILTFAYWLLSGGLTFFNKWFFSTRGFHFPILVVCGTFVVHSLFTFLIRVFISARYYVPLDDLQKQRPWCVPKLQTVSRQVYLRYLSMIGICTGLEIASSNLALVRLSVSFHTMVHASKPIFIAGWSVAIGLERADWKLFVSVGLVACGVLLLSLGESSIPQILPSSGGTDAVDSLQSNISSLAASVATSLKGDEERIEDIDESTLDGHFDPGFDPHGFALILFSCFCSGARWSFVQLMLQRIELEGTGSQPAERLSPFNLIYYVAPISVIGLSPFFAGLEAERLAEYIQLETSATPDLFGFELVLSAWSLVLTLTEFYFVRYTSGLVLAFAAISKELLLVTIAVLVNGDRLPALNVLGFLLCVLGILSYHRWHRASSSEYEKIQDAGASSKSVSEVAVAKGSLESGYPGEKSMEAMPINVDYSAQKDHSVSADHGDIESDTT